MHTTLDENLQGSSQRRKGPTEQQRMWELQACRACQTENSNRRKCDGLNFLVGATMSKFAKCQTQANCQECPAGLAHSAQNRGKDSNMTKEFCRLNPQSHQNE